MSLFLNIFAALILIKIVWFCAVNTGIYVDFYHPILRKTLHIREIYMMLGCFAGGIIFTLCASYAKLLQIKEMLKRQSRNAEKNLVSAEASQDKVKMLEAKVETLEIALKEALKK